MTSSLEYGLVQIRHFFSPSLICSNAFSLNTQPHFHKNRNLFNPFNSVFETGQTKGKAASGFSLCLRFKVTKSLIEVMWENSFGRFFSINALRRASLLYMKPNRQPATGFSSFCLVRVQNCAL